MLHSQKKEGLPTINMEREMVARAAIRAWYHIRNLRVKLLRLAVKSAKLLKLINFKKPTEFDPCVMKVQDSCLENLHYCFGMRGDLFSQDGYGARWFSILTK
ncbi:hypothetical protein M8C21_004019, partial [Ambrosia artemisiifolia]